MAWLWLALLVTKAQAQFGGPGFFRVSSKMAKLQQVQPSSTTLTVGNGNASLAFNSSTGPNSLIICAAQTTSGSSNYVTDTGSNTYTAVPGTGSAAKLYYTIAANPPGTITASFTATAAIGSVTCFEYSGVKASSPLDASDFVSSTGTVALRNLNTSTSPEFVFAYVFTSQTATPGSTLTKVYGGAGSDLAMHAPAPYLGTYKVNFTQGNGAYTMISASFKLD